jgi:tRNA G37 N-methylase Trm5
MVKNSTANHCASPFLSCYNMDGRVFIAALLQPSLGSPSPRPRAIDHVLMNLPQSATDFLDVFIGFNKKRDLRESEVSARSA